MGLYPYSIYLGPISKPRINTQLFRADRKNMKSKFKVVGRKKGCHESETTDYLTKIWCPMLILLLTLTLTSRTTRKEFNQRDWSLLTTLSENLVQAWQLFPSLYQGLLTEPIQTLMVQFGHLRFPKQMQVVNRAWDDNQPCLLNIYLFKSYISIT